MAVRGLYSGGRVRSGSQSRAEKKDISELGI